MVRRYHRFDLTVISRPCPSYPGWVATIDGRIWSQRRPGWIKPYPSGGYFAVKYHQQVIADAFLGPCPLGQEVNHKDLDKHHNHADNLEYLTHAENIQHARQLKSW